jgi:hypothetical protein
VNAQAAVREGFLEGFTAGGRAELRHPPGATEEQELRHAGRLAGQIAASRAGRAVRPLDLRYATALAMEPGQRMLGELTERDLLNAHRFACAWAERRGAITEQEEHEMFDWLLDQADVRPTPGLIAKMRAERPGRQTVVARRLARQAGDELL